MARYLNRDNAFLIAVVGSGVAVAAASLSWGSGGWPPPVLWLAVLPIVVLGRWPIEVDSRSDGVMIGLDPSVAVFLAFVVGVRPAVLVWLVGVVISHSTVRKNAWTRVFNVAATLSAGVAAIAVVAVISGPVTEGPRSLVAVAVAGTLYLALDLTVTSIATMVVDGQTLSTVLRPPNLLIASCCFGCVVSLGYLAAVIGRHAPWSTPVILLPLVALCAAARSVRRTRVDRTRSVALFEMSSAAQRAVSEDQVLASLALNGSHALRSRKVGLSEVPAGAGELGVALPLTDPGPRRWLVAAARNTGEPFDDDDCRGAELLATLVAESLQRLSLLRELDHLATYDPLTGLLNRRSWHKQVDEILDPGPTPAAPAPLALLFCDLDEFKQVNDRFGHAAGDAVLVAVASRISGCLRPGDIAARLGGDEFAVAVIGTLGRSASGLVERIRATVAQPIEVDGVLITISTSIGVATLGPATDRPSAERLLGRADDAMYQAKRSRRGAIADADR